MRGSRAAGYDREQGCLIIMEIRSLIAGLGLGTVLATSSAFPQGAPELPLEAPETLHDAPGCLAPTGWQRFGCDSRTLGRRWSLHDDRDRRNVLIGAGATAGLYALRDEARERVLASDSSSRTALADNGRLLSRGIVSPLLAGGLWLASRATADAYHAESAQILLTSTFYATVLTGVGNVLLAAERPSEGDDVDFLAWDGHGVSLDVALAASVVAPLDRRYLRFEAGDGNGVKAWKVAGRAVLYAAVGLTALQRMEADKHWLPDVFLGGAAGLTTGYMLCTAHGSPVGRTAHRTDRPVLTVLPGRLLLTWAF